MPLIIENIRWVFFDLGYTLINEDGAALGRLRQVCDSLAELGVNVTLAYLVRDLEEASERYDPSPFASVLERLIPDPQQQDFVRKSGRYPKELDEPYPDAKPLPTPLARPDLEAVSKVRGIKPAKALGMQTVRILQGVGRLQKPRTDDERPDATVKDLAELATILID